MADSAAYEHEPYSLDEVLYMQRALIDSLEHILFGDVQGRSRDELENRASEAICAWNERPV